MHLNIACADILDWAASYNGPPFHAMLCDPPYSWGFMSKKWDNDIALRPDTWAALAEHLYPGAFIIAFAGPRTYHRLACALEDAGLRLHSPLGWVNGQGFPKSQRVDTQIDKAAGAERGRELRPIAYPDSDCWSISNKNSTGTSKNPSSYGDMGLEKIAAGDGMRWHEIPATDLARAWQGHRYGLQALKPCLELIAVAQKPYEGKPVECIVETGAGALWIDGGRIVANEEQGASREHHGAVYDGVHDGYQRKNKSSYTHKTDWHMQPQGRWPANFALCHLPGCERIGVKRVKGHKGYPNGPGGKSIHYSDQESRGQEVRPDVWEGYADPDGLETVDDWHCVDDCPVKRLGEQSGERRTTYISTHHQNKRDGEFLGELGHPGAQGFNDKGTAARFFFQAGWSYEIAERLAGLEMPVMYCPKAGRGERDAGLDGMPEQERRTMGHGLTGVSGDRTGDGEKTDLPMGQAKVHNPHPTVKPISLCKWLATLLLPPPEYAPRRILVPFAGSGSEGISAGLAGWDEVVMVELIQDYCGIARARADFWLNQQRQLELAF